MDICITESLSWILETPHCKSTRVQYKVKIRDFHGGPVTKIPCSQCRDLGFIPGQRSGSQMPQLRPGTAKINKYVRINIFLKNQGILIFKNKLKIS